MERMRDLVPHIGDGRIRGLIVQIQLRNEGLEEIAQRVLLTLKEDIHARHPCIRRLDCQADLTKGCRNIRIGREQLNNRLDALEYNILDGAHTHTLHSEGERVRLPLGIHPETPLNRHVGPLLTMALQYFRGHSGRRIARDFLVIRQPALEELLLTYGIRIQRVRERALADRTEPHEFAPAPNDRIGRQINLFGRLLRIPLRAESQ